ncbi:MAG: electron transfer flavoprotein subunit beta/FixA family protein, partial [SAR324 cluster bacterium]|nr:electron transfer flavoprotein subunit beta/FixA family protein [SAR324 cluster bacterium]
MMKILVCVKQVAEFDVDAEIKLDESCQGIVTDHLTAFRMNRFDEYAVEEALLVQKIFPDVTIDALTVGPADASAVIKRAMGMGANHGIHILTPEAPLFSAGQVAQWISMVVTSKNYDLILTGVMSEDQMQGQVGPMLAEYLDIPCATSVISETPVPENRMVNVEREIEGGFRDILELKLPAVLTIQSGINLPRYPSLSNVMRAKRAKLEIIESDSLGLNETTTVTTLDYPGKTRAAEVLT